MRKRAFIAFGIIFLSMLHSLAMAQSPSITAGTVWLTSSQTATGNWPEVNTSEYHSTSTALDAVYLLDPTNASYASGFAWMTGQVVSPTDYLSRRIIAIKRAGADVSAELDGLLLYRNSDGSWGGASEYLNTTLDTALVLQALKAANYPDLSVINTALAYLTNSQNPDGGWGFRAASGALPADPSNVYMTAIVSATLRQFPQTASVANAVAKATAYLIPMQNVGGGFGFPSSTVYETSLAYAALIGTSADPVVLGNTINYLISSQSSNGSWNDDPYSTALALKTLYLSEHIPAPPPPAATTGSVMGTIVDATTKAPLAGVNAQLTSDPTRAAASDANGMFALYGIPAGSQQITLSAPGYAAVTITSTISAGTFINLGKVELSVNPTSGTVMGTVWNKDRNTPFGGVTVQVTYQGITGLPQTKTALSAADGTYKIMNINPGTVTVGTPQGPAGEGIYWNVQATGTLAAGGIFIYNPQMSQTRPAYVNVYAETDKALYRQGDTVGTTFRIQNNRSIGYGAVLNAKVLDPSGAVVHTASANLSLIAKQMTVQTLSFVLPANGQGGFYTVVGEVHDANEKIGEVSANFGIFRSSITVKPVLPAAFSTGANTVSFSLVNEGNYDVNSGVLDVKLQDPDGQVIASEARSFGLGRAATVSLSYSVSVPPFKFGQYTLAYTQSDETTAGQATVLSLPNTVSITPIFDKTSYKIRETANVMVNLSNSGRFALEDLSLTVAAPDAGYSDTKAISLVGNPGTTVLRNAIPLPEFMKVGSHETTFTLTLSSGSTTVVSSKITVPESSVVLALDLTSFAAGGTISPVLSNTGGVDTTVQYTLKLYDDKSSMISSTTGTQAVQAGASVPIHLAVPAGAASGSYVLAANYQDTVAAKTTLSSFPLTIAGVKGTLSVRTGKQSYLATESISGLSSITNAGTALQNGNLHLQVTTAGGQLKKKTWTSQYEFQQGTRSGADTYAQPDSGKLVGFSDDFNDGFINLDRWNTWASGGVATEMNGVLNLKTYENNYASQYSVAGLRGYWLEGDFDIQVDFTNNTAGTGWLSAFYVVFDGGTGIRTAYHWYENRFGTMNYNAIYTDPSGQYDVQLSSVRTSDFTGKLRLQRSGGLIIWYYWNNALNRWEWNGNTAGISMQAPTTPAQIRLENAQLSGTGISSSISWDNLVVSPAYTRTGTLNLIHDAGASTAWNKLLWSGSTPTGTSISFRTRTAETQTGLATAAWSAYLTDKQSPVASPAGRWIEIEAKLVTTDPQATPVLDDVTISTGHAAGDILWQADVPVSIAPAAVSDLASAIGTLGVFGKLYLQGSLTSGTGQSVAFDEYPFYVAQGATALSLGADKKIYKPGETVTISGEVKNSAGTDAAGLTFILKRKIANGTEESLYTETFSIPAGGSHPFLVTATAGTTGVYALTGTVTQNNAVLAEVYDQYEVSASSVSAVLSAPDTAGREPIPVTITLTNSGKTNASFSYTMTGAPGGAVDAQTMSLAPGATKVLQYSRQISADTTFTFAASGDLNQTITKTVRFDTAAVNGSISAGVVTDKLSYGANEQVALTSTITSLATGSVRENCLLVLTLRDGSGAVLYADARTVPSLMPKASLSYTDYWSTGTNPAGIYPATLELRDAAGALLATASRSVVIESAVRPRAALTATVTVDHQSLLSGETVTAAYSVTNAGNADIADLRLDLLVMNTLEQTAYGAQAVQTALSMGLTHTNTWTIDTRNYTARDYLVILRASVNSGAEETLAGSYFRVEGAPTVPSLSAPAAANDVLILLPILSVNNASDPNDDKLTYEFELYTDSGMTTLVAAAGGIAQTSGTTVFTAPVELSENSTYYWRSRAFDGKLYSEWMQPASFRVNVANDPPTLPAIGSPADNTEVSGLRPTVVVNNASDPDSTNLTYNFQVALDPLFTQITASVIGVFPGQGATSWEVSPALSDNTWYWWRAQADDWLDTGPWSAVARFFVNMANDAPTTPVVLSPANNAVVTSLNADIVLENSTDVDSPVISYFFEVDSVPTFDSASVIRSGIIPAGPGTTTWQAIGLLDNTLYYVHARASDGSADSSWTPAVSFFINTANDAPTTPVIANPSIGAGVNVFSPTLAVHNATDLDRDALTYEFEVFSDAAFTSRVAGAAGIAETAGTTSWTVPVALTENQTYYWRARAFDGSLNSGWAEAWFAVNTANDAPGAPALQAPAEGSSIASLTPTLAVVNAVDPDSDTLTYDFEVYSGTTLAWSGTAVPQDPSGITSVTVSVPLADNTIYQWRARAYDGDRYGPWMGTASFTVHVSVSSINATVNFDPDTLNRGSNGQWVTVYIELPAGYSPANIAITSIRLEGSIPAEARPTALGDVDKDGIPDLMVKFRRSAVIAALPAGDSVPVHVTGRVGTTPFEGVDIIRVIH